MRYFFIFLMIYSVLSLASDDGSFKDPYIAELLLYDLEDNIRMLRELDEDEQCCSGLETVIVNSIIRKVVFLRRVDIEVGDIRGSNLETACLLSDDIVMRRLKDVSNSPISNLAIEHIRELDRRLRPRIEEIQERTGGSDCRLLSGRKMLKPSPDSN